MKNKKTEENYEAVFEFNYSDAFDPNSKLSQFITVLSHIHSNLTLCFSFMSKESLEEDHPDAYIYFLGNALSHSREAVHAINMWSKEEEIYHFIKSKDLGKEFDEIKIEIQAFPFNVTGEFLMPVRNRIFHYSKPNSSSEISKTISDLRTHVRTTKIKLWEDGLNVGLSMDYTKDIISSKISQGYETESEFKLVMEKASPVIVDIIHFCKESIGMYFDSKGLIDLIE